MDDKLVLSFLLGDVAIHSCSKLKPTTAELHETTFFPIKKRCVLFHKFCTTDGMTRP